MFLIHDDQAKVLKRQVQRGSRADDDLRRALSHHFPAPSPFGHGHAGMPLGGTRAEARLDPRQELGGQGNFRQQDQRLPPLGQTFRDGLKVHLSLARTGHALQHRRPKGARGNRVAQGLGRRGLIVGQVLARAHRVQTRIGHITRRVFLGHGTGFDQPLDHRRGDARHFRQFGQGKGQPAVIVQHLKDTAARIGHPVGVDIPAPINLAHRHRPAQTRCPRRKAQHRGQRRQRVIPRSHQECAHVLAHRGNVQNPRHTPHPRQVIAALARSPDHADHLARAQRHLDKRAKRTAPFGRAVIQRTVKRLGGLHRDQCSLFKEILRVHPDGS